ncbi:sacsin-like, partial [Kryptolebias marmoratus]|uniref:sacsin-like n=1 Tax=Kryptolebias marmoratus TaxID=37003 RepID=UPI0018ACCF94
SVRTFLQAKPLNDPTQTDEDLPLPITETLIRDETRCSELLSFCLSDDAPWLRGVPLLLTKDKILRVFNSKSPKLISRFENLFLCYRDIFADYKTNGEHIHILQKLNLVNTLTLPSAAQYLKPIIQHLLQSCEADLDSDLYVPNETMLKWLELLWRYITSEIMLETFGGEESLTISDVKNLFSDCSILPVVCPNLNNKQLLQTMKEMSSVIPVASEKDISNILFKLGFMKLDNVFFSKASFHRSPALHTKLMDVNDSSAVLSQVCNINHSKFSHVSNDDMKEFQNFLQSGVFKCKNRQDFERKFKSLPIFETTLGKRVRIDGHIEIFVLNSFYSVTFPDLFTLSSSNSLFLKYNSENVALSELLEIKILKDLDYFMKFILPAVHRLTEKETLNFLKLLLILQHDYQFSQYKDNVISTMKSVKLIHSCQGRLEMASYFFDDHVELYKKMVPQEKFVPEKFWTDLCAENQNRRTEAKKLIRELGMKHDVSTDDIINFATQLESEAKGNRKDDELQQKSDLLFRQALRKVINDKNESLLRSIADIKLIFPVKIKTDLCSYHQQYAAANTTVQIRGSLIDGDPNHQELIWSSMPIIHLPVYFSQNLLKMMKNAGAHDQPPSQCVISNMRNICQSPCKTDPLIKTRAKVFRRAYAYLQANGFDEKKLAGLPVILVEKDTALFKAGDVCLSLDDDLEFRPYLYKTSSEDALYAEFFKKIGVKKEATAVHYCNVLAAVYEDSCDKQQLNANQQKTVKRAVQQLFHLIKTQEKQVFTADVQTLYLPAVDGKLYPSCSLYYNDTVFETKRLEEALEDKFLLLEKLSKCHLGKDIYEHHRLVQLLPQKFRPKMLSEITEEKMVEPHMQLCELGNGCDFSGWFDKHLSSGAFRHGLICLLREQSQGQITEEEENEMCEKIFGSIQIVCCETLETMLWLDTQPLNQTTRETDVFVKREQQGCTFYLKHNDDITPKVLFEVNMILTKEINVLLDHGISSVHLPVLGQLLMCDDLQDVQKTLAKNQIRDSAETESIFLNPPDPGTDIPDEWHDSLDMGFLNNFEEGEYVGYSINNKYIHAVIVEELPEPSGRLSKRYKIDIGEDEPVEVTHLDLYQFKREKKPKPKGREDEPSEPGHQFKQEKKLKVDQKTSTSSMELETHVGAEPRSSQPSPNSLPSSLDEAKKEIDKCLNEIWSFPEEERRKGIRRLYLKWHPDKNPDCLQLATEAFIYLQNRIDELTKGKCKATNSSYSSGSSSYTDFYQHWDQEARHHRRGRERFFRGFHNTNIPKPNKEEAQRWYKQARCDLDAAQEDTGGKSTEWCLFKVHQAVEKALFAAEYKRNGRHSPSSTISTTAAKVSHYHPQLRDLPRIVEDLKALGVDAKKTQYPNYHPYPHIPNGQFRSENEMLALNKASELLSKIEAYVN